MKIKYTVSLLFLISTGYLQAQKAGMDSVKISPEIMKGYTTEKTRFVSGSISALGKDQLQEFPAGDLLRRMQGLVPGLTVIGSGQPGEMPLSFIRGIGRFLGSTPLFIVDGVPFSDLSLLNPDDVEQWKLSLYKTDNVRVAAWDIIIRKAYP